MLSVKRRQAVAWLLLSGCVWQYAFAGERPAEMEVVVYGGTPAGVMAAVAAARLGRTVTLLEETRHVGGVVSGGLVSTDIGDRQTVGGLADEFFRRIEKHYLERYGRESRQYAQCHQGIKFEPHVAERLFEQVLAQQPRITLFRRQRIKSVTLDAGRIASITVEDLGTGKAQSYSAAVFIDASYTGDLMAAAHAPYRVGRESRREFDEYLAGLRKGPAALRGSGDHRSMAFNYRVSLSMRPENRVLFPKPEHYDPAPWRATYGARIKSRGVSRFFELFTSQDPIHKPQPNDKLDANWCDLLGGSEGYAEGNWETRARIEARHRDHFLSLLYYLQNDAELPEQFRADAQNWGLPRDEFVDNGHFPHQIYVRQARRMLGRYILSERDLTQERFKPDGVCAGSYGIDCHWVQEVLTEGRLVRETNAGAPVRPYDIPYRCLTPYEPANLLVPVCLSTTHVAYCSLRMEPVFMMLGQASGVAAHLAVAGKTSVQTLDVAQLRGLLRRQGAVLDAGYRPTVQIEWTPAYPQPGQMVRFQAQSQDLKDQLVHLWWDFEGTGQVAAEGAQAEYAFRLEKRYSVSLIVEDAAGRRSLIAAEVPVGRAIGRDFTLDEADAELAGAWQWLSPPDVHSGPGARGDVKRGGTVHAARARFAPTLPAAGKYQVCLGFRPAPGQATRLPVLIRHAQGTARLSVDERTEKSPFPFTRLGEYLFRPGPESFVELKNSDAGGRVVLDAVRWVWAGAE